MLANVGSCEAFDRMRGVAILLLAHIILGSRVQGVQYLKREKRQGANEIDGEDSLYSSSKLEDESHLKRFLTENMNSGSGLDKLGEENWERIFKRFFPKSSEEAEPAVPVVLAPSLARDIHHQRNRLEIGKLSNSTKQFSNNNTNETVKKSMLNSTFTTKHVVQNKANLTRDNDKHKTLPTSDRQLKNSENKHVNANSITRKTLKTTKNTTAQSQHNHTFEFKDDVEDVTMKSFDRLLELQNGTQISEAMEALNNTYDNLFSGVSSGNVGGSASGSGASSASGGGDVNEEGSSRMPPQSDDHSAIIENQHGKTEINESRPHTRSLATSNKNSSLQSDQTYENLLASSSLKTQLVNNTHDVQNETRNATNKTTNETSFHRGNKTALNLNATESLESKLERSLSESPESTSAFFPSKEEMSYFPDSTTFKDTPDIYSDLREEDDDGFESGHDLSNNLIKEKREIIDQRSSMATLVRQLALLDPNDDSVSAEGPVIKRSPEELHEADSEHDKNRDSNTTGTIVDEVVEVRKRSVDDEDDEDGFRPSKPRMTDNYEVENLGNRNKQRKHKRKTVYDGYYDTSSEVPPSNIRLERSALYPKERLGSDGSSLHRHFIISDDDPNADILMANTGKEENKRDERTNTEGDDSQTKTYKHEKNIVKKMKEIITDAMVINAGYKKDTVPSNKRHQKTVRKNQNIAGYWTGIGSKPLFFPEREGPDYAGSGINPTPNTEEESFDSLPVTSSPTESSGRLSNAKTEQKKRLGRNFVKAHKRSSLYNEMKSNFLLRNQRSLQKSRRMVKEPEVKYTDSNGKANVIIAFEDVREMVPRRFHSFEEEDAPSFYLESEKRLAKSVEEDLSMLPIRQREDTVGKLIRTRSPVTDELNEEEPEPEPEPEKPVPQEQLKSTSWKRSTMEGPTIKTVSMDYHMNRDENGKDFSTRSFADIPEEEKSFIHVKRAPNEDGYLGCFVDVIHPDRDLPVRAGIPFVTPNNCRSACKRTGYYYAGLQYGYLCFCGNTYGRYDMAPETECSHTCSGDGNKTCGGYWRNAVFDTAGAPDESNEGPIPFYLPPKKTPDLPPPKIAQESQASASPTSQMQPTNAPQVIAPPPTPPPNPATVNNVTQPSFFLSPSNEKLPPQSPPVLSPSPNSNKVKFIKIADITKNGTTILQPGAKLLAKSIIPHLSQIQLISTSPIQPQALTGREVINTDIVKKSAIPQPLQTNSGVGGQVMFNDPKAVTKEATPSTEGVKKDTVLMHWAYIHPQERDKIIPTLMPHPTQPLKVQPDTRVYKGEIRLRQNWFDDFKDSGSPKFQILAGNVEQALKHIYENDTDFLTAKVLSFREGVMNFNPSTAEKVICQFTVTFKQDAISPDAKLLEFTRSHGNKLDDMPVYGNTLTLSEYHFDPKDPRQPFLSPSNITLDFRSKVPRPVQPVVTQSVVSIIPKANEEKVTKRLDEHPYVLQGTYAFNAAPQPQTYQTTSLQSKGMQDLKNYLKNQNSPAVASLISASKPVVLQLPANSTGQVVSPMNYTRLQVPVQAISPNSTAQIQPKKKVPYILRLFFWKDMLARKKRAAQSLATRRRLQRRKRQDVETDTLELPNTLPEGELPGRRRKKTRRKTKDLSVEKELRRAKRS